MKTTLKILNGKLTKLFFKPKLTEKKWSSSGLWNIFSLFAIRLIILAELSSFRLRLVLRCIILHNFFPLYSSATTCAYIQLRSNMIINKQRTVFSNDRTKFYRNASKQVLIRHTNHHKRPMNQRAATTSDSVWIYPSTAARINAPWIHDYNL